MRVIVYVEGPSDQRALQALLRGVIDDGRGRGIGISFSPQGGKAPILSDVPRRAAEHLKQNPGDWVFALPDLYPMAYYDGTPSEHRSFAELSRLLQDRFTSRADRIGLPSDTRRHFRVHCLKHDLEALVLAAPDKLRERLKTKDALKGRWRTPVEDQNDARPPKRIVEELFRQYPKSRTTSTRSTPSGSWSGHRCMRSKRRARSGSRPLPVSSGPSPAEEIRIHPLAPRARKSP